MQKYIAVALNHFDAGSAFMENRLCMLVGWWQARKSVVEVLNILKDHS